MSYEHVLEYPAERHERRHWPLGYADYKSFKPWLRDEFVFRCVYCLWRERWCADGDGSFGVDHVRSRSAYPEQICDYGNVVYACCRCNSLKQDTPFPLDPCDEGWGNHLRAGAGGTVLAITSLGQRAIEICRLNRPALVEARRRMLQVLQTLAASRTVEAQSLLRDFLAFPANLPVLSELRPPGGNSRPEGVAASHYERRKRGKLQETY
jgi:hypothetical protein